jgi:hypothetical protein
MTDWPALLLRLKRRDINIIRELHVSRMTVWRWMSKQAVPHGNHAAALLMLDAETDEQREEREKYLTM